MAKLLVATLACSLLLAGVAFAADTSKCEGVPNDIPINTAEPKIIQTVKNGYKMSIEGTNYPVVHVYGNAYEMGQAHGELLKEEIPKFFGEAREYFIAQIVGMIKEHLPKWLPASWITAVIDKLDLFDKILAIQFWLEKDYIPKYVMDEYQGLADGSGIPVEQFQQFSVLPEVNHMNCSMLGAWGPATKSIGGTMLQLRSLDWDVAPAFQKNAIVLIYHPDPNANLGHDYALWTWAGFVGAITGYSSKDVGMSEYGRNKDTKDTKNTGYPTPLLMRDILQFDNNRFEGYDRIKKTDRTASVFLGLGDPQGFNIVSYNTLTPEWYGDHNMTAFNAPAVDNAVYIEDHHNGCFAELFAAHYGEITAETLVKYWPSMEKTGNLHAAIYDMARRMIWISVAHNDSEGNFVPAYNSKFTRLDLNKQFAIPAPSSVETVEAESTEVDLTEDFIRNFETILRMD